MNTQTAGVWVPVSINPPEERYYRTKGKEFSSYWHGDKLKWDVNGITHWLDESIPTLTIQQALEVWDDAQPVDVTITEGGKVKADYPNKRTYFLNKFGVDIDKM